MKKTCVIWTGILLLLGMTGLAAVFLDINRQERKTALYKTRYKRGAEEYVQQYLQWSKLSPSERLENPWGGGNYGGPQTRQKLISEQPDRLCADIADLANGTAVPVVLADVLYGPNWQQAIERYRKRNDIRDGLAVASTISILAGTIVLIGYSLSRGFQRLLGADSRRRKSSTQESDRYETYPPDDDNHGPGNDPVADVIPPERSEKTEPLRKPDNTLTIGAKTIELRETLRSRASDLSDRADSPQPSVATGTLSTLMSTAPVGHELNELTQEVSAIREYAASQQDRVQRLQDGYDWNIIKRFCIRIIRCIDNLDERMASLAEQGEDTQSLEDVRDELIFSLESSGVEQFEPEINASYKGLEKNVEAVKTKVPADDPDLVGKIAKVVKPGYQYVLGDEESKIVRCSQVELYGATA